MVTVAQRAETLFTAYRDENASRTSRAMGVLMLVQWGFAVVLSLVVSPRTWEGRASSLHVHVVAAVVLGGVISSLPLFLVWKFPAAVTTRMVVAVAQMLWSALLIHLAGGRIETHFHIFGSLAFLAFYRDWRVLVPATLVVVGDHAARGVFWPESVYGITNPEWWRFLEHAGWVVFEDIFLVLACQRGVAELRTVALRQAEAEAVLQDARDTHDALSRTEKLAAVGQLAASVGHELRNPLAAVRNSVTYISKRVLAPNASPTVIQDDKRIGQFFQVVEQELNSCSRFISDLLDFARERPPARVPCPLRPLVQEAIALIPPREGVEVVNDVSDALPVPDLDKDQFRQVVANLVQNATEAVPTGRGGSVRVGASGGDGLPWTLTVTDDGTGMSEDVARKIFEPLFTTKTRGTGLGLAIVAGLVKSHGGTINVQSAVGQGSTFSVELPARSA